MKKMLILALIALFYIVSSALTPPQTVPVDQDVGYSLIANQNTSVITILPVQSPVIAGEVSYTITRGSSVIDKGLINSDAIVYNHQESFTCNTYYTIDRLDSKLPILAGFENQIKNPPGRNSMSTDLGGLLIEYDVPRDGAKSRHI